MLLSIGLRKLIRSYFHIAIENERQFLLAYTISLVQQTSLHLSQFFTQNQRIVLLSLKAQ